MKCLGVIPARYASTRFPGKPLALIQGKPMILWVAEAARNAKSLTEVRVATDDLRIFDVVKKAGFSVVMTEPELPSGTDRIFAASQGEAWDVVVNIQGDEPLIPAHFIDSLVEPFQKDPKISMTTLGHVLNEEELASPNSVKVLSNQYGDAIYFSRFPIPYSRENLPKDGHFLPLKHIGLYAYRSDFLKKFCQQPVAEIEKAESLEQLRALNMGARIRVIRVEGRSFGIDTPEDLVKIETHLTRTSK